MKSFFFRHDWVTGIWVFWILWGIGMGLMKITGFWGIALMVSGLVWMIIFYTLIYNRYVWACKECGRISYTKREKYCTSCGGQMHIARKKDIKPQKYCPKGHKIDDFDEFCPKCGTKIE